MTGSVRTPIGEVRAIELCPGKSINEHFIEASLDGIPVVAMLNNEVILRKEWSRELIHSDNLNFVILPLGGGGGRKLITILAVIAIAVAAFYLGPVIAGALGYSATGSAAVIASAGVQAIGSMIVSAILPPVTPKNNLNLDNTQSPTYSIGAQGNSARLLNTIPRLYGKHILYPDFASTPYINFQGNDQYLYQLFCLGLGHYQVHSISIEDARLWNEDTGFTTTFSDVSIEIVNPGEKVTLFPAAVETKEEVAGQELVGYNRFSALVLEHTWLAINEYFSADNFGNLEVGETIYLEAVNNPTNPILPTNPLTPYTGFYTIQEIGVGLNYPNIRLNIADTARLVGYGTIKLTRWYGPFVTNTSGTKTKELQLDFYYPQGLIYFRQSNGSELPVTSTVIIEVRKIDDSGAALTGYTAYTRTHTLQTKIPQRITETINLSEEARYEVRVRRSSHKSVNGVHDIPSGVGLVTRVNAFDVMQWASLRSLIIDDYVFPDVTLLAVKIKANSQLSQASSRRFNTIQTAKLPTYNGSTWGALTATQNPAWALADVLRNSRYGADLPDSRIDLVKLKQLADLWASRNDKFNGIFDSKESVLEALSKIAKVGRAQPLIIGGIVSFMRDESNSITRCFLTPKNIIKDTLNVDYVMHSEDSPDSIVVEYMDERTWELNEVACSLGSDSKPARIQMFGVTNRNQAWREGMYQVANNIYRRIFANCEIEMEGRMLLRGDSVMIAHDMTQWGRPAEIVDWGPSTRRVTVNEPVSGTRAILSNEYGGAYGHILIQDVSSDGLSFTFQLSSYNSVVSAQGPIPINLDFNREPTRITVGTSTDYVKKFKVLGVTPKNSENITVEMVIDDSRVYSVDSGSPPTENIYNGLGGISTAPATTGLTAIIDENYFVSDTVRLILNWNNSPGAISYQVQISRGSGYWQTVYDGLDSYYELYEKVGTVSIRVSAFGLFRGAWNTLSDITLQKPTSVPSPVLGLSASLNTVTGVTNITWSASSRAEEYRVSLYSESSAGVYDQLEIQKTVTSTSTNFSSTELITTGGPWENMRIAVEAHNGSGYTLPAFSTITSITLSPPASISLLNTFSGREINLSWVSNALASSYQVELLRDAEIKLTTIVDTNYYIIPQSEETAHRSLTVRIKSINSSLSSSWTSLNISDPAPASPTGITTSSPDPGLVEISWDAYTALDFKEYVVYQSYTSPVDPIEENEVYRGTEPNTTITGLTTGVTSYFRVSTHDNFAGNSGFINSTTIGQLVS